MVGRITVVAIGAAGVVVAGLSVASATLWRPDDVLRASVTTDSPYVVTAAGVVEMGGQPTTVTVTTADGQKAPLVVAVGRDTDVVGWVGDDPHETVSGMSGWSTLRIVSPTAGTTEPTDAPAEGDPAQGEPAQDEAASEYQSPAGSDMWLAEATGEGRAELKNWAPGSQYPGRWSVLVANPTEAQATVELAWPRKVSTPWLVPGLILGLGAVGWAAYTELRRRGILTFRRKAGPDADTRTDGADGPSAPRSRREVRAAQAADQSGPVPVVDGGSDPTVEPSPWGTAAFTAPADAAPEALDTAPEPSRGRRFERALPAWSPARTWQRARHSTEPDIEETPARSRPAGVAPAVAPPAPIQPPPTAPERPRTPAWSRTAAPTAASSAVASPAVPAPVPAPAARPTPLPAPSAPASSGRRRAWPPAPQSTAATPEVEQGPADPGPTTRRSPFGRSARPAPGPAPSAPTLGASQSRPAPPGGWMPGRGGRTGAVPQVPAPTEQTGGGRRPTWLGLTRSPSATGPVPAAPQGTAQSTAPRLSAGPQPAVPQSVAPQSDPPRGDAWRQIWGISTDDGSQEDR